jgi:hypothetical protein
MPSTRHTCSGYSALSWIGDDLTYVPLYLRQIVLAVADLPKTADDLCYVFDTEIVHTDPSVSEYGIRNVVVRLGSQFVELVTPLGNSAPINRYLSRHGEGLYAVLLQCDDDMTYRRRADELKIRRVLELEFGEFRCFQLHPIDAEISVILEIDQQPNGPYGAYYPGGGGPAAPLSAPPVITGISVATADPGKLAERWGELLLRSARIDSKHAAVSLDNAELHFLSRADPADTIGISVHDPEDTIERAASRGLPTGDSRVQAGGIWLDLSRMSLRGTHPQRHPA